MLRQNAKNAYRVRMGWPLTLMLSAGLLAGGQFATAGGQPGKRPTNPGPSLPRAMAQFLKLSPAERYHLFEKAGLAETTTQKATRGVLRMEIVERGTLEAARSSDVVCTLRSRVSGSTISGTIRWLIDAGSEVKKGDKLIELDDSGLQEELKLRSLDLAAAVAGLNKAQEALRLARTDNQIDTRLAEIALRFAERRLKRAANNPDQDLQDELKLKVEEAQLTLKRVKAQTGVREATAQATVQIAADRVAVEKGRKSDVEAELRKCVLRAPQDGMVVYFVPEQVRGGTGTQQSIVAQGEPVREGQKLIQIPDLSQMQLVARVHEAFISHLHGADPKDRNHWQRAKIRVDAFPNHVLDGHVKWVATAAEAADWFASDVKLYRVIISIDTPLKGLRPGMSAEANIVAEQTSGPILQVPLQAVLAAGKKHFCIVLGDKEVHVRAVETGLSNDTMVQIRSGVKEGERVVLSPRRLMSRLDPWLAKRVAAAPDQNNARRPAPIVVRSVKPPDEEGGRRTWIATYGLTYQDRQRIAALPTVHQAIPVRMIPQEVHRLSRFGPVNVVATTPDYAEVQNLDLSEGRFLTETDGLLKRNVVVLGATVADKLFPGEEPLGSTVVLNKSAYVVVGVLNEQNEAGGNVSAWITNRSVYMPLQTCQVRFGKRYRIIHGARRSAEEVALHAILVTVRAPGDERATREDIAEILEQAHAKKDWSVQAPTPF